MHPIKRAVARTPIVGPTALMAYRAKAGLGYYASPLLHLLAWVFASRETGNFTYDLTEQNQRYLASLIGCVLRRPYAEIAGYLAEVEGDEALRRHVRELTAASSEGYEADPEPRYGRRIGWYAFARAMKPRVIVETGVDKGLGSCVLTAALIKNREEGYPGRYYGTDISPVAGYLLADRYADEGEILYGDSIESLRVLERRIDLFINDSDHSAEYEQREYETVRDMLSEDAVILGDNSHVTDKLLDFALATDRQFVFFPEKPANHWYPGAGIGIAFHGR